MNINANDGFKEAQPLGQGGHHPFVATSSQMLEIGFVNNMAPAALRTTQQMFLSILREATLNVGVNLTIFSTRRSSDGSEDPAVLEPLWESRLDALIVTGAEPRAASLRDEPNWTILTRLVDWAAQNTLSTFWSCLAAHGAVLHLDGLSRRPLERKCSGIFDCVRNTGHALLRGLPAEISMPHSRHNSLDAAVLTSLGYRVLTQLQDGDVDLFVKKLDSLFVFAQGHPEYEATTLLREYRRDVRRFLERERDTYPQMPENYFDAETSTLMETFRRRAFEARRPDSMWAFPEREAEQRLTSPWRPNAVRLLSNWLDYVALEKARRRQVSGALFKSMNAMQYEPSKVQVGD